MSKTLKTSTTDKFLADRVDGNKATKLETGVWYSGFEKVKDYALKNNIPFVAVWSNGEICSLCKKLEVNFMTDTFKSWMKTSGCIFWFGYSGDKAKEDKTTGKAWAKDDVLKVFPFMRFYWSNGTTTVNKAESGKWWNGGKSSDEGALNVINNLNSLLSQVNGSKQLMASSEAKLKIRVNPEWTDEEVAEFRQAIKDNDGYCPCVEEHSADTKCMCKWFREQTEEGDCHCGLYNKYYAEGKKKCSR